MAKPFINPEPDAVTIGEYAEGLDIDEDRLTPEFRRWLVRRRDPCHTPTSSEV